MISENDIHKTNIYSQIKHFIDLERVYITQHAWNSMDRRCILFSDIMELIRKNGRVIEEYYNDKPCPSCLIGGMIKSIPLHVVVALCNDHVMIITVYKPDPKEWINYRIRTNKNKGGK